MTQPAPTAEPTLAARDGALLWLTLNRPDRLNAVSQALYEAVVEAVRSAEEDTTVRAIIVTGAGRAFCAGADLKAHAERPLSAKERRAYVRTAQRANVALQRSGKPVIAAVNGPAVGAGLELALSCDFVVVAEDAKLRLPEISLGTFFGGGVTYTLSRRVGLTRAKELLLIGDFFTGAEAAAMGLANVAVPRDDVREAARAFAMRTVDHAPLPMRLAKDLLHRAPAMSADAVLRAEERALLACMATKDWTEGIAAHRERRRPRYTGD
jgi:enoyl-CoA hydratase